MPENQYSFELARPIERDAKLVMTWRNDPGTLQMFYHREPKVWESFFREFLDSYFNDPNLPPVFALDNGKRVAFLRFLPVPSLYGRLRAACDISINVDPALRNRGIGSAVIEASKSFLRDRGVDDLYAEVRVENEGSRKAFIKAGFAPLGECEKLIEDTGEKCRICRFHAALTKRFLKEDGVFIIAEAGSNWRMGGLKRDSAMAKALIDVAAESRADAVKFQTYRPETTYAQGAGESEYLAEAGYRQDIHEIFADLAMPYEMIPELAAYCAEKGIEFMSTPFSTQDFAAIDPFVKIHKIASYELSHVRLLEAAAKSGKPLILSTGACAGKDIAWAVNAYIAAGGDELCLMQCTAKYPAPSSTMNLKTLPWLKSRFGVCVGLSDHSRHPTFAPLAAVGMGARVIEKHFTLDNRLPGPDHAFAVLPGELKEMVEGVREVEKMLGDGVKEIKEAEKELADFARRALQATADIQKGDVFAEGQNFDILRPGKRKPGAHPRHIHSVQGKRAARDIPAGDGIRPGDWEE